MAQPRFQAPAASYLAQYQQQQQYIYQMQMQAQQAQAQQVKAIKHVNVLIFVADVKRIISSSVFVPSKFFSAYIQLTVLNTCVCSGFYFF